MQPKKCYFASAAMLLQDSLGRYIAFDQERQYTPMEMEFYDSLAFRFEKTVEMGLHYFRALELQDFGESSDTLRNRLLRMEKLRIITSASEWIEARKLRNRIAHVYAGNELAQMYREIEHYAPILIKCANREVNG